MEKETLLKKMQLSINQENISTIAISNTEERKQLWEEWKRFHPESKKTWKTSKAQISDSLRCQASVIIKKVSAKVETAIIYDDLLGDNSSIGGWSDQGSIRSFQSQNIEDMEIFNPRPDNSQNGSQDDISNISNNQPEHSRAFINPDREFILDNLGRGEESISKLYINDEILAEWSKKNLTAFPFPINNPPTRALSEPSRYELKRFHTYIPEKLLESEIEEEEFYEEFKPNYDQLLRENIQTEWNFELISQRPVFQG